MSTGISVGIWLPYICIITSVKCSATPFSRHLIENTSMTVVRFVARDPIETGIAIFSKRISSVFPDIGTQAKQPALPA